MRSYLFLPMFFLLPISHLYWGHHVTYMRHVFLTYWLQVMQCFLSFSWGDSMLIFLWMSELCLFPSIVGSLVICGCLMTGWLVCKLWLFSWGKCNGGLFVICLYNFLFLFWLFSLVVHYWIWMKAWCTFLSVLGYDLIVMTQQGMSCWNSWSCPSACC